MGSRLEDKVAIVTGAARGTGAEIARHFVREGAKVWIADLLEDQAGKLAAELGEAARAIHLDVTDEAEWGRAVEEVTGRDGRVDVLVNNAAVLKLAPLTETTGADFERLIRVNQIGPFLGIRAVFEAMKAAMHRGERIELRGFGVFQVKPRKKGIGRNPRTGREVRIPPGKTIRFKPGKNLRDLR